MKISKKRFCIIGINILIWSVLLIYYFSIYKLESIQQNWSHYVSVVAITLLILQLIQMHILKIKSNDFMFWYIPMQFLFYFGRIILYWLNLDEQIEWRLFSHYPMLSIYHSSVFALCFFQGVFIGMIINKGGHRNKSKEILSKNTKYSPMAMAFSGIAICLLSLPFLIIYSIKTIAAQRLGEYIAVAESSGFVQTFYMTFFAGIILIIFSHSISKNATKVVCIIYSIYGVLYMLLSGDRRQIAITLIVMVLSYIRSYDVKIKPSIIISSLLVGYCMLSLLSAISTVRIDGITVKSVLDEATKQFKEHNIMVQVLGEFGGTFFTIVNATTHYPEKLPFVYGKTYLASILIIFPKVFTFLFPDFFGHVQIAQNMEAIDGNPCGGSLGQDLYANFGSIGIFGAIFTGVLMNCMTRKEFFPAPIDNARYYIKFYICINLVRAGIYEIARPYAYALLMTELFCWIYRFYINKKFHKIKDI